MIITIDGTAGSGKSAIAQKLSQTMGYKHINTGAFYRSITWLWLHTVATKFTDYFKIDSTTINENFYDTIKTFNWGQDNRYIINGEEIKVDLFTSLINDNLKHFSLSEKLRSIYIKLIQEYIQDKDNLILEGRGVGVDTAPNAHFKFYIDCDIDIRAYRRAHQLLLKYETVNLLEVKKSLEERDNIDLIRNFVCKEDNYKINTNNLSIENAVINMVWFMHQR